MFRKLTTVIVILALTLTTFGCRKKPAPPSPASVVTSTTAKTEVKTQAEYDAQAKKDINTANMKTELDKIEKDVEKESGRKN